MESLQLLPSARSFARLCLALSLCLATATASQGQTLTTLVNFAGPNGAEPRYGSLILGVDGNFYGTTRGGGGHSRGTIFKMAPSGALTTLYSFCSQSNCTDGSDPDAGLTLGTDGNFYGTTTAGGTNADGAVFKMTSSGAYTVLHSFSGSDGNGPAGTLVQGGDGSFYGVTPAEGAHGFGTVFKITSNGALTTIYNFCALSGCGDGGTPFGGLARGADGNFYGTTSGGGAGVVYGTVFKITPNGTLTTLHSFAGSDGRAPYGKLVQASDGNFYGTTTSGGTSQNCTFGCGTIFKITPGGVFASLHSFTFSDGSYVVGGLIQASDGNFYGTTGYGGSTQNCGNGCGTAFMITPGGTLTTLHNFAGFPSEGSLPVAGLLQSGNAVLGTTEAGGSTGDGSVFSLAIFQTHTTTVVTSTPNPSQVGDLVTITATVNPSGPPTPTGTVTFVSNGVSIPSCVSLPLSSGMAVCMTSSLALGTDMITATYSGDSNYAGSSGMLTQIVNPVPSPLQFVASPPCRVVDTRNPNGTFGGPPITGNSSRAFPLEQAGNPCGIPSNAVAYSLNVTVVPMGPLSYLTIWPTGEGQPGVSTLNSPDGRVKANAAIVPAGTPSGSVSVYVRNTANVVLDIDGYFIPSGGSGLAFYPLTPCRVVDTRNTNGPLGGPRLPAQQERDFPLLMSTNCIPSGLNPVAYSLNFTAVPNPSGQHLGYLTVWPAGQSQPTVSTLNNPTGTTVANAAIVPAGTSGEVAVYASATTDLLIDINGYFAAPAAGGYSFYPVVPCRVYDTRNNHGPFSGELMVNVVGSPCAPPSNATGYVFNATVLPSPRLGFLTLWPDGQNQPVVSTLNAGDGAITSNMAIVPNLNGTTDAFAGGSNSSTQLILDLSGYFAP